jgi:hypothetical protein
MPPFKDEMVLNVDGFVPVDPALAGIRSMLEHFTQQRRSWWRRLMGA